MHFNVVLEALTHGPEERQLTFSVPKLQSTQTVFNCVSGRVIPGFPGDKHIAL